MLVRSTQELNQLYQDHSSAQAALASPAPSLLADLIQERLASEKPDYRPEPLPEWIRVDLRPHLPKVGHAALAVFMQRKVVQSFPLIYNSLALANPN